MKKIVLGIFAFIGLLFLTACGCSKVDYEIVFNNDGNRTIVTVEKGDVIEEPAEPTKDGYIFVGWFKSLTDKDAYDFSEKVTSNFTLYAKWEKEAVCDLKCEDGYTLVNPDSEDCKCEKNETEEKEETTKPTYTPTQKPTTIKYTVKFDSAGGSSVSDIVVVSGNKVSAPTNPTRDGYKFIGWYLNNKSYDFNTGVTGNITLIAKWEKIETPKDPVEEPEEKHKLSYKIEDIAGSVVGQVRLYLTKDGVITAGNADIITVSGKTVNKDIPVDGYVTNKGIIDKVINIKID